MEPERGSAADRARADIAEGRLWKARDRLATAVRVWPADQEVLELLGEVHFRMGDLPAAGRFWLPTARTGPDVDAALTAFEERWGSSPGEMLKLVPLCGEIDDYPETARERLRRLGEQGAEAGVEWRRGERRVAEAAGDRGRDLPAGRPRLLASRFASAQGASRTGSVFSWLMKADSTNTGRPAISISG